jgi:hypothetical protein
MIEHTFDEGRWHGELASALDGVAAEDLFAMPAARLLEQVAELIRARNRIDADLARTVRRAELAQAPERDGLKTMASWLRGHARLSPAGAAQLVGTAGPWSTCQRSPWDARTGP